MTAYHRSPRWLSFTRKARPLIEASLPQPCVNPRVWEGCTGIVFPGQAFDVGHRPGVEASALPWLPLTMALVGPSHRRCNRRHGAKLGRAKQLAAKRADKRLPPEGSGW